LFLGCSAYPECGYTCNIVANREAPKEPIPTDQECPQCKAPMVIRDGRAGPFLACSRYPDCKTALPLSTGVVCPQCGKGELVQRRSKRGKTFYSCSTYPNCDCSYWNKPVAQSCPNKDCDSPIMEEKWSKKDGSFLQCPKCKTKYELSTGNSEETGK
jgi:DNA topoisomerase I